MAPWRDDLINAWAKHRRIGKSLLPSVTRAIDVFPVRTAEKRARSLLPVVSNTWFAKLSGLLQASSSDRNRMKQRVTITPEALGRS